MQTADRLNKAVSTWQRNDRHSARISRQKLHLRHYVKNLLQHRVPKTCCILHIDAPPSGDIYLDTEGVMGTIKI